MNIGRLESVLVRELWKHEQYDFLHGFQRKKIYLC